MFRLQAGCTTTMTTASRIRGGAWQGIFGMSPRQGWRSVVRTVLFLGFTSAMANGAPGEEKVEPVVLQVGQQWRINDATHHVQGLCITEDFFWLSSVERREQNGWIFKVDRKDLKVVAKRELVDGPRFHPGGMQLVDGTIWVPLAEYRRHSTTTVLALNAETLSETNRFSVDDHLGAVAVDDHGKIYAANWDARQIYVFDDEGKRLRMVDSSTGVAYQDFECHDGYLWGTGRTLVNGSKQSVVDVLDIAELTLRQRIVLRGTTATVGPNFAREGFTLFGKSLYLMPEDGPETRVYEFRIHDAALLDLLR